MFKKTSSFRLRLFVSSVAFGTGASLALVGGTVQSAQALDAAPANFRAAYVSTQGVGLRWSAAADGGYRVRFATNKNMKTNADTWDVLDTEFEWTHMDANPNTTSPRLKPGATYYFQVKAIDLADAAGDRKNLSKYTEPLKVTLPKSGDRELKPVNLKATPAGPDSMYVSWSSRGPGMKYILRYTTDPSVKVTKWSKIDLDAAGGVVTGLKRNTRYHFRSRVVDTSGKAMSPYSKNGDYAVTMADGKSPRISLVSYNIRKASGSPTWATRRKPVADMILSQAPDVVALQEATPLKYKGVKQYDDIVGLLGSKYSLVTRKGSSGSKLVYNSTSIEVIDTGVKTLTTLGSATRYAVWAVLEHKDSRERFFVINTHLEPGGQTTAAVNNARIVQAREILAEIEAEAGNLPVIIAGDMNSSRAAKPENGQYRIFTGAGYIDPTDNADYGWAAGHNSIVEHPLDWEYSSANSFASRARRTAYPVGTNIDYIYTAPGIRVGTWRTVVNVDTNRKFVGTLPSDHNMLAVNVNLTSTCN